MLAPSPRTFASTLMMLATSPAESPIDMLDLATWRDDHAIRAIDLQRTNRQARCIG